MRRILVESVQPPPQYSPKINAKKKHVGVILRFIYLNSLPYNTIIIIIIIRIRNYFHVIAEHRLDWLQSCSYVFFYRRVIG